MGGFDLGLFEVATAGSFLSLYGCVNLHFSETSWFQRQSQLWPHCAGLLVLLRRFETGGLWAKESTHRHNTPQPWVANWPVPPAKTFSVVDRKSRKLHRERKAMLGCLSRRSLTHCAANWAAASNNAMLVRAPPPDWLRSGRTFAFTNVTVTRAKYNSAYFFLFFFVRHANKKTNSRSL